jgi:hypothetical protein
MQMTMHQQHPDTWQLFSSSFRNRRYARELRLYAAALRAQTASPGVIEIAAQMEHLAKQYDRAAAQCLATPRRRVQWPR